MIENFIEFTEILAGVALLWGFFVWPVSKIVERKVGRPLYEVLNDQMGYMLLGLSEKKISPKLGASIVYLFVRLYMPRGKGFRPLIKWVLFLYLHSVLIFWLFVTFFAVLTVLDDPNETSNFLYLLKFGLMLAVTNCVTAVVPDLLAFPAASALLRFAASRGLITTVLAAFGCFLFFALAAYASAALMEIRLRLWEARGGQRVTSMANIQLTLAAVTSFFPMFWVLLLLASKVIDFLLQVAKIGVDRAASTELLLLYPYYALVFLSGAVIVVLAAWATIFS